LKEIQEREYQEAMYKDLEKSRKQKEEEDKLHEQEREAKRREEEAKQDAQRKKEALPPEPAQTDANACEIAFRLPSGTRLIRRFPRSCTIQVRRE
jgi:FAS-associated factor 2